MGTKLTLVAEYFCCLVVGACATIVYFNRQVAGSIPQESSLPNTVAVSPAFSWDTAPSNTARGQIIALIGDISWQSRTATQPAAILLPRVLQQGESLFSGSDGRAKISFPDLAGITLSHSTRLDIIQTLPSDLVFAQQDGTVNYSASGSSPLSVRTLHLLIRLNSGSMSVEFNQPGTQITVSVSSGSAVLAYNDLRFCTVIATLVPDSAYLYADRTRRGTLFQKRF